MRRSATISPCGRYRYMLTREWAAEDEPLRWVAFCGLNPSTADATIDDPTIRREIGFARSVGANALVKVNIHPFRATSPRELRDAPYDGDAREENWRAIELAAAGARGLGRGVFAAWGAAPKYLADHVEAAINALGRPLMCLGVTKDGSPRHPLYLPSNSMPFEWRPTEAK